MSQMLHDDRANGMFSCKLVRGEGDLRKATGIGRGILAYNTVSQFRHIDTSVFGNAIRGFINREGLSFLGFCRKIEAQFAIG